jgi:hypothetical protein
VDQAADQGAGDCLCHGPARRRASGHANGAVALAQDPIWRCDQDAVSTGRVGEEIVQGIGQHRGRRRWCFDRRAQWPRALGIGQLTRDRLRIEQRRGMLAQQNAAVTGAGDRHAQHRLAEAGIVPHDLDSAIGVVGLDRDVSGAMSRYQPRRVVSRRARGEVAGRGGRPPAEMPIGRLAIQTADIEHVDHAFGGEIHGALAQRACRRIAYDRIGRSGAEGLWRTVEGRLERLCRSRGFVLHLADSS